MKPKYTLWRENYKQGLGIMDQVLATDNKWYIATNSAMKFDSVKQAKQYFKNYLADTCNDTVFVKGPRNGFYMVQKGKQSND